ncbi:MAG: hypothetical protein ACK4NV_11230 [Pannonibacter sp.]
MQIGFSPIGNPKARWTCRFDWADGALPAPDRVAAIDNLVDQGRDPVMEHLPSIVARIIGMRGGGIREYTDDLALRQYIPIIECQQERLAYCERCCGCNFRLWWQRVRRGSDWPSNGHVWISLFWRPRAILPEGTTCATVADIGIAGLIHGRITGKSPVIRKREKPSPPGTAAKV